MSAFLGPIHFWLYNKINNQELLTRKIAILAIDEGWNCSANSFTKSLPELESAIDQSNIHSWLQSRIDDAETRFSNLIETLLEEGQSRLEKICSAAFHFGKEHSVQANSAAEIFKSFEDFFVNGMPCDRVNLPTENTEKKFSWQMTSDIHAKYWKTNSEVYYQIRKSVMDGMLFGSKFKVEMHNSSNYSIIEEE